MSNFISGAGQCINIRVHDRGYAIVSGVARVVGNEVPSAPPKVVTYKSDAYSPIVG